MAGWAKGLHESSKLLWIPSAHRRRSISKATELAWQLVVVCVSCAFVVVAVELSGQILSPKYPKELTNYCYSQVCFLGSLLTAGKAKNEIPNSAQKEAIILPCHVSGTISP